MKYDAVIFDLFGTLVDSSSFEAVRGMLVAMAEAAGIPPGGFLELWMGDTRTLRSTGALPSIEAGLEHICRRLGATADPERIAAAVQVRRAFTRRALTPRPDTVATLRHLGNAGYRRGLISDCSPDVPALWKETSMAAHVDAAVFSCTEGVEKPDPRIYRRACDRLGVEPGRCLYVGDGDSRELTGARDAGMDAVMIRVPHDRGHRLREDTWSGTKIARVAQVLDLI
jgi:putative hydrolase of the HAD superfamily